ncbi:hypothetical protein AWZ03_009662 [Drosophila navojoa]|uniref:FAS1 domain-containing protein n=1 Tax=Drosophila navojoa TaxID=7232 RepID=A0A484B6I3_DRONA|nr:hypothetical protein AWZ03_009662 [Drosophila navojoa]
MSRRMKMLQVPAATFLLLLLLAATANATATAAADSDTTASSIAERQIDGSLKNAKLIESKVLPDLAGLQSNQEDDKWQHIYRFINDGFPVLELYGYKTKTVFGCNIYRYRPHSCKFQRRKGLQNLITLMHYLWLRPWIVLTGILYLPWFLMRLLIFISHNTEDDRALVVMYFSSALLCKYQNLIATLLILYIYKYRLKCVDRVLNGFAAIHKRYWRLYGCAPRINWSLFGIYVLELLMVGGLVIKENTFSHIPYVVPHSPIDKYLSWTSVLFVALQPFLLGLLAHLGLLLLHAYYDKELQFMQEQKHRSNIIAKEQVQHYVNLMHLRHHFEVLLRPFVWVALSRQINDCMISLHLLLYDHHRLGFLLYQLCFALLYPMCFVYQTIFIKSAEKRLDTPFTLIIPKIDVRSIEKPRLKEFMLEHLVPGKVFDSYNALANGREEEESYGNGNGHKIVFRKLEKSHNNVWLLNGQQILYKLRINEQLMVIGIDGYLGDRKSPYSKRNIQETNNRYNDPQPLEEPNITNAHAKVEPIIKESKASPLMSFLANMKTGTKVFQHFLSKSNLTRIMDDNAYTVLIPSDNAFQRWHPIDWGFYPFSVPEFTESVLRNHFLPMQRPLRLSDVKNMDQMVVHTMGGENVVFHGQPTPTVNNVSIMSDYTLSNGNQVFIISEVLFVSEAVVSKLHQMHKDKETPPLLAFPWFGAQFLSHSFLALERDSRFTQITRYLNNAEIAPHISGANYTFFVPEDKAFEKIGFDRLSDDVMASQRGIKMLLNHFVRGRLYNRDLRDNEVFETIGGGHLKITRNPGSNYTSVNNAQITESEVFVYNLGTMYYIDDILYSHMLRDHITKSTKTRSDRNGGEAGGGGGGSRSTIRPSDVEIVPNEFESEHNGGDYAIHGDDEDFEDEIITPKALPVQIYELPK